MEKQDPVEVAPNIYKVPLENDRVRVLDIHMQPGDKSPQHSPPAHVLYIWSPVAKRSSAIRMRNPKSWNWRQARQFGAMK